MSQPTVNSDVTNQIDVPVEEVDLLVVGGGKADKSLAMLRAEAGDKIVMVERDKVGGTCVNIACIPTKTLISTVRVFREVQGSQIHGATLPEQDSGADALAQARIELASFRARKEAAVGGMVAAHKEMFPASGMDFVKGTVRFMGERIVEIALNDGGLRRVCGVKILINTGTTSSVPLIEGLSDARYWASENLLTPSELPSSLIVLGDGVIGVEMASLMGLLGIPVTIAHAGPHILDYEDEGVAAEMTVGLEAPGVMVLTGARAPKVVAAADRNGVVVIIADGHEASGSHLLVALGRTPVTAGLGLETASVKLTECGFVCADNHLRTIVENVYAAGDVAGMPQFTHASWSNLRVLHDFFAGEEASITGRLIPWAVFTMPELGHVGMSEAEAREAGYKVCVAKTPTAAVPCVKTLGHTEGFLKVIIDAPTDLILGAAIIGTEANEVVISIQVVMLGDLT